MALLILTIQIFVLVSLSFSNELKKFPKGHGDFLGKHRESDGHVDILDVIPTPSEFWTRYASIRKPVVFKGAAKNFPAYSLWTNNYLTEKYGDLEVKLESKKEKDNVPVGERGVGRDTIKSFLKTYVDKDSYMVSQLPDPLATEVMVLPCLMCGSFSERILEANLWLSSGGTKSMLHKDADNAVNCLLNGTKDWILIHPENEENIPVAEGDRGYGGFAVLDVDKVNLLKYPNFKNVRWQYANLTAGDCLYLPYSYWHQVRSYGSKNMAVSVLFSRLTVFNNTGCDKAGLHYTRLSDVNMVWTYPGHGAQTMGNPDPFELKDSYIKAVSEAKDNKFTLDMIFQALTKQELYQDHPEIRMKIAVEVFGILDPNSKGHVDKADIMALTIDKLKAIADITDRDYANTEEYEHVIFSEDEVRTVFVDALREGEGQLHLQSLIKKYTSFGGSEKVARELFAMLKSKTQDMATASEVETALPNVLELYTKRYQEDESGLYYHQHLQEDKEIMASNGNSKEAQRDEIHPEHMEL